ncbi:LOW QUALITY PROTEIN: hypothetical protein DAPPUDRAFT_256591 [Daphnia pulex]|uniref:Uncharacterized protein n=1 Tax=Daphnia pulex TaxID=6669 RepID=E9HBQ2_DAPPU|nr:LOW QUALITY PROTEIN: hypothetical protein DAPPUDRAFT_256591 [Daphnia pulex]|eukprot:EFX70757.1 LOW QUALITY PROTEIN: hypothetical protein DAPPUDRAFT_256591 [Daphnia pulex]
MCPFMGFYHAKHLCFTLPQSQDIASPPLALDISEIPLAPEAVEDDTEVVMEEDVQEEVTHSNLNRLQTSLSFEQDGEPLPEAAQAEEPDEIVYRQEEILAPVAVEEEDVVDDGEHSDVGMELTNLEATSIRPACSTLYYSRVSHRRDGR